MFLSDWLLHTPLTELGAQRFYNKLFFYQQKKPTNECRFLIGELRIIFMNTKKFIRVCLRTVRVCDTDCRCNEEFRPGLKIDPGGIFQR